MRRHLMRGGYETAERRLVARLIEEGDRVLELGASIGVLSSIIWKMVGSRGRVISVEPNAELRPHFEKQMHANGLGGQWVEALCCPIWEDDVPESIRMQPFVASRDNLSGTAAGTTHGDSHEVQWRTGKQLCVENDLRPTALVVDIEGAEGVWSTYRPRFPDTIRVIIAEIHPDIIGADCAGASLQSVLDEGFRVAALARGVIGLRRN